MNATCEREGSGFGGVVIALALGGLVVVLLVGRGVDWGALGGERAVSGTQVMQLAPLSEHASVKHPEALVVHMWLSTHDTRGCRWDCSDGRTRYACQDKSGQWLFAVEDAASIITAFFADQSYIVAHTRDDPGCRNDWWMAHP